MFEITIKGNTPEELYDFMQEVLHKRSPVTIPRRMPQGNSAPPTQPANPTPTAPPVASSVPQGTDPTMFNTGANFPAAVLPSTTMTPSNLPPAAPTQPPNAAPTYTLDQLAEAGATLAQSGKMEQALAVLARYGVQSVNQLRPEQYGPFATELRALGAQV